MITYACSFSACKSCGIQSKALDKSVNTAPIKTPFNFRLLLSKNHISYADIHLDKKPFIKSLNLRIHFLYTLSGKKTEVKFSLGKV